MNVEGLRDRSLFKEEVFVGGQWAGAASGARLSVDNPANGAELGSIPDCNERDVAAAIDAATTASASWRDVPAAERATLLETWHGLMLANVDDLARIMTAEQGKPLAEAAGEIRYAATFVKWFAEEARRINGSTIPAPDRDRRILVLKEPVGVSAAITPWNFPAAMITRKCAPALAAGCPVIIKPSELTPYTALALVRLAELAGFPAGVVNIVTGRPQTIGRELTANPGVRKISFTGSTAVGALLMRQSADTIKRLSLELGGNAPLIVFDDADIDLAVTGTMLSKFRNAGQTCVCANRIFVQDGIYDRFAERVGAAVSALTVAEGLTAGAQIGPLINAAAIEKVNAHLDDALSKGAVRFAAADNAMDPARFATPTVLTGANPGMRLAGEETFGPLAALFRFTHEAEAVEMANATQFGLASYFFTENFNRAMRVAEKLETGMVGLNTGTISMEVSPFGGIKQSGIGREGGHLGIEEYLEVKTLHLGGLSF